MRKLEWFNGIHVIRFKARLGGNGVALQRYRFRDVGKLRQLFKPDALQCGHGRKKPGFRSFLSFWFWLHRTFRWLYAIVEQKGAHRRIIGMIGFYDLAGAGQTKLAITIFAPADRGRGYGRQALELLFADLRHRGVLYEILVDVARRNKGSIQFFRRLAFEQVASGRNTLVLKKSLSSRHPAKRDGRKNPAGPDAPISCSSGANKVDPAGV